MQLNGEKEKILVVDDSSETVEVIKRNLQDVGYVVYSALSVVDAIKVLESTPIDLVLTDLKMPKVSGLDLIRHVRENYTDTEVMMITGYATINGAVEAIKTGAEEYLTKPFTDEELINSVKKVLNKLHDRRTVRIESLSTTFIKYGLIGNSLSMQNVFKSIEKVSLSTANVLITGESGTGKELVARAIHYRSNRSSAPFVPVNCGGIPETLLESELFGFVKGAFTGANESRAGFFQTADGGTIFLDEISETSLAMQVKLLRVLEDKQVYMVGSDHSRQIDIRIIAATNKDLLSLVRKGIYREDLYFRLNVITINLPPLSGREDDILVLINHFARKYAKDIGKPIPKFSDKAIKVLRNYNWPGNVRELENVIQRIVVMTDGELIEVPDLPSLMRFSVLQGTGFDRTLQEIEIKYIENVLVSVDGNKTKAAEILGIDRKTLREKLKQKKIF